MVGGVTHVALPAASDDKTLPMPAALVSCKLLAIILPVVAKSPL
jgi:hypothetical protein